MPQQYSNHAKYYTPHHFVFYPVLLTATIMSAVQAYRRPDGQMEWIAIAFLFFCLMWLSFMLRQHYALGNQNRIVRLELRLRYFILTGKRLEPLEQQLSFGQLAAVRFASDEEFPMLIERAVKEQLTPSAIKRSVRSWLPDHMRV
ncbi:MAG TPA: DUF6526 family protein [Puia sp.]|nr:DUF6526 family protein [Puia sp.]